MFNIRNYAFITIGFLLLMTLSCASSSEATDDSTARKNVDIPEILKKSAELFEQREDLAKLREAVKTLAQARHADNRSYEVEWTYAKYSYFLGKQSETEKEIDTAFKEGEKAGLMASRIEPNKPDGFFWFAANLGEAAKRAPMTVGLKRIDEIRDAMKKVIELQPDYQGASAFDGLARIELETGIIGGKTEKAIEYLEKGLELEKNNSNLRLNLAKAYLRVDRDKEAKEQLDYIVKMEPDRDYKVEYQTNVKEAKRLIESRF